MARMNEKKKILIIAGVAVTVSLLAGGGVYWTSGLIEAERQAIAEKRNSIAAADQKIAKIAATERETIILRENLGEYVKILPEHKDLNAFVKTLNTFERQSGIQPLEIKRGRLGQGGSNERFLRIEYQYDMTATLWQFMKFINSIENYERFVAVSTFSIASGGSGSNREIDTRDGDTVHSIKLTMETYTYNAKGSVPDVEIPDYEEKRKLLLEEIFKRLQAIRIDRHEHRGVLGRRDVFVDPRQQVGPNTGTRGVPVSEQKKIIDQYVTEVLKLREMLGRVRRTDITIFEQYGLEKALREGVTRVVGEIAQVEERGVVSFQPYRLRWTKEVVDAVDEIRRQIDGLGDLKSNDPRYRDPYLPKVEMEQLAADMGRFLQEGNLEEARNRFEVIQQKLGVPADDPRHGLAVHLQSLHVRAVTAIEFRNLDLRIQGVLVNHDGRSGVVLNGEVYEEGDYISDDLFVKAVREEQVHFVFRGLTLVRTL